VCSTLLRRPSSFLDSSAATSLRACASSAAAFSASSILSSRACLWSLNCLKFGRPLISVLRSRSNWARPPSPERSPISASCLLSSAKGSITSGGFRFFSSASCASAFPSSSNTLPFSAFTSFLSASKMDGSNGASDTTGGGASLTTTSGSFLGAPAKNLLTMGPTNAFICSSRLSPSFFCDASNALIRLSSSTLGSPLEASSRSFRFARVVNNPRSSTLSESTIQSYSSWSLPKEISASGPFIDGSGLRGLSSGSVTAGDAIYHSATMITKMQHGLNIYTLP